GRAPLLRRELGPAPPRFQGARLAVGGTRPVSWRVRHHPWWVDPGGHRRAGVGVPGDRDGVRRHLRRGAAGRAERGEAAGGRGRRRGLAPGGRSGGHRHHCAAGARHPAAGALRNGLCQTRRPAAGGHLRHGGEPGHLDTVPMGHGGAVRGADRPQCNRRRRL
ncbi:MAG: Xanthine-guanine phosphoribosyltransferase, partial [uncultured Acetobacteraceae bacterium]